MQSPAAVWRPSSGRFWLRPSLSFDPMAKYTTPAACSVDNPAASCFLGGVKRNIFTTHVPSTRNSKKHKSCVKVWQSGDLLAPATLFRYNNRWKSIDQTWPTLIDSRPFIGIIRADPDSGGSIVWPPETCCQNQVDFFLIIQNLIFF